MVKASVLLTEDHRFDPDMEHFTIFCGSETTHGVHPTWAHGAHHYVNDMLYHLLKTAYVGGHELSYTGVILEGSTQLHHIL